MHYYSFQPKARATIGSLLRSCRSHIPGFDIMRFVAASAVIWSHSFGVAEDREHEEPLRLLTHGLNGGNLAVYFFFVISGFLVTQSYLNSSAPSYLFKRAARILPGLYFVTLVCALIIGPFVTSYEWRAYFTDSRFWKFFLTFVVVIKPELPGVFQHHPSGDSVNVPLWTIRYEVLCYLSLMFFALKRNYGWLVIGAVAIALSILGQENVRDLTAEKLGMLRSPVDIKYIFTQGITVVPFFFVGSLYYLLRESIPVSPTSIVIGCIATVVSFAYSPLYPLFPFSLGYLVVCLGFIENRVSGLFRKNDYSYGIYLFGFPVQQTVLTFFPSGMKWWRNFLIAYPIAVCFAVVSWHLIEKPCLAFARRVNKKRRAETATALMS